MGRKIPIKMSIKAVAGEPVELFINDGGKRSYGPGRDCCHCRKAAHVQGIYKKPVEKLGSTIFESRRSHLILREISLSLFRYLTLFEGRGSRGLREHARRNGNANATCQQFLMEKKGGIQTCTLG